MGCVPQAPTTWVAATNGESAPPWSQPLPDRGRPVNHQSSSERVCSSFPRADLPSETSGSETFFDYRGARPHNLSTKVSVQKNRKTCRHLVATNPRPLVRSTGRNLRGLDPSVILPIYAVCAMAVCSVSKYCMQRVQLLYATCPGIACRLCNGCMQHMQVLYATCAMAVCTIRKYCMQCMPWLYGAQTSIVCSVCNSCMQRKQVLYAACAMAVCSTSKDCIQRVQLLYAAQASIVCSVCNGCVQRKH
jgi:hypothetical protein